MSEGWTMINEVESQRCALYIDICAVESQCCMHYIDTL